MPTIAYLDDRGSFFTQEEKEELDRKIEELESASGLKVRILSDSYLAFYETYGSDPVQIENKLLGDPYDLNILCLRLRSTSLEGLFGFVKSPGARYYSKEELNDIFGSSNKVVINSKTHTLKIVEDLISLKGKNCVVNVFRLNMRSSPKVDKDNILAEIDQGTKVKFLESKLKWSRIRYKDSDGWVSSKYIECEEKIEEVEIGITLLGKIKGKIKVPFFGLNLYRNPEKYGSVVQIEIDEITNKIDKGTPLSEEDKVFLQTLYNSIGYGAKYKGVLSGASLPDSGNLMLEFIKGNQGGDVCPPNDRPCHFSDPALFENSRLVKKAMEEIESKIKNKVESGERKGLVSSTDSEVLYRYVNYRDENKPKGEFKKTGILLVSKDEDMDLFYSYHQFALNADYEVTDKNELKIRWYVKDIYDFDAGDTWSDFPIPNSDKRIRIPDRVSNALYTKYDLAKPIDMYSEWETESIV